MIELIVFYCCCFLIYCIAGCGLHKLVGGLYVIFNKKPQSKFLSKWFVILCWPAILLGAAIEL